MQAARTEKNKWGSFGPNIFCRKNLPIFSQILQNQAPQNKTLSPLKQDYKKGPESVPSAPLILPSPHQSVTVNSIKPLDNSAKK